MRSFRDSTNVEWTMFEVRRQVRHADASSTSHGDSWLCFENSTAKRRLLKYPERWREFTDVELARLLQQATPAPRTNWSLNDGIEDGSPAPGA